MVRGYRPTHSFRVTQHTLQLNFRRGAFTDPPIFGNPFGQCSGSWGLQLGIRTRHDELLNIATTILQVGTCNYSDRKSRG